MALSMWIIADKLSSYSPQVSIVSGKMEICGVRPLGSANQLRDDILYVSLEEPDGSFGDTSYILCTHGHDWIKLQNLDINEAIGVLLDIFESHQRWINALEDAVVKGRPIQHFLDISDCALPFPTVVFDTFGNIVAYAKSFDNYAEMDDYWKMVVQHRRINDQVFSESMYYEGRPLSNDWNTLPKIYQTKQSRIVGMHLTMNDEIVGTMIIVELGGELTTGVRQLAALLHDALSRALDLHGDDTELRKVMAAAEEFLDGKPVNPEPFWERIIESTGRTDEDLELILLKNTIRFGFTYKNNLAYRLNSPASNCFAMVFRDYVGIVICCNQEKKFSSNLRKMLDPEGCLCGISMPFSDIKGFRSAGIQAALALLSGSQEPGSVNRCVDHAYTYFLNKLAADESFAELLHPDLARLKKYDEKHNTNYYDTLYQFLMLERNVVATAKSLYIHRNSMIYRLQRISQLLNLDLDNPNVRLYLLLSYQIEMVMNNKSMKDLMLSGDSSAAEQDQKQFWSDEESQ